MFIKSILNAFGHSKKTAKLQRKRAKNRLLRTERLESRRVFDAGWVAAISGPAVTGFSGDSAGNTYVAGKIFSQPSQFGSISLSADSPADIFVAKQNANGQFLWATKAGGNGYEHVYDIVADAVGNVFITGTFDGTAQFGTQSLTSAGANDIFVAKLDGSNGQFLWAIQRGSIVDDRGTAITIDPSGNVLVSGGKDSVDAPGSRWPVLFVNKFDTNGTELWERNITGSTATGGLYSLSSDSAGNIFATGKLKGSANVLTQTGSVTLNASPDHIDPLLTKLDSDGNWLWARTIPTSIRGVVLNTTLGSSGQLYVSGTFEGVGNFDATSLTGAGNLDMFVSHVNATTGVVEWARRFGGVGADDARDVEVDPQGNVHVVGSFRGTADFGSQILTTDGVAENAFVTKLDPSGMFIHTQRFITGNAESGTTVAGLSIDVSGNLTIGGWLTGKFGSSVQFPQQTITSNDSTGYVVKLPPVASTKFYVVDDSAKDRTYQYGSNGELTIDSFSMNTGNASPRGAASNAAGTKVWVGDRNRSVYTYSNSGALQGSWSAGSLPFLASVEGVATNGTDVWIVENASDRIYRYTGAASRVSGSQNAASNFKLNSANSNPKGIVTDGTSIWVVNDSTTDKIFKYTVGGSFLGSWTIDSANKSPTGLTIDPTNGSQDIWVVDNGTDKIYQYANSRSRTSGSQVASATYVLAIGNTNPQGIADPPPVSLMLANSNAIVPGHDHDTAVAVALGAGPVPMPSFDTTSSRASATTLPRVQTTVRDTDDFMSSLGNSSQMPQATTTMAWTSPVVSCHSMESSETDELQTADDDINDLIGFVAKNLWN